MSADLPSGIYTETTAMRIGADGVVASGPVLEAAWAPTRRVYAKWAVCAKCGYVAPQNEMRKRGGSFLCTKYGCSSENQK